MYQALYRKYRPRRFEDVVGQEHITETLRRQVELGRTGHAYIFVGTRGTGKTTCAKILSRALNCEHPVNGEPCNECAACRGIDSGAVMDVIEIDAASNGSVEDIRALREAANYTPADVKKRVYILDEAHMITTAAFPALLKILEEPPEHLVFILATTNLEKIPITILSRCQHFSFRRITPEDVAGRLKYVAAQEGFGLTDGAAALLSRLGDGSMRDALSLLDQCLPAKTVDEDTVVRAVGILGAEDTLKLWRAAVGRDTAQALELFDRSYRGGAEPISILRDLLSLLRDMLMVRVAPEGAKALLTGAFDAGMLASLSSGVGTGELVAACEILQENVNSMKDSRDKRVKAELCLLKLIAGLSGERPPARVLRYDEPAAKAPERKFEVARQEVSRKSEPAPEKPVSIPEPEEDLGGPPPWEDLDAPPEPGEDESEDWQEPTDEEFMAVLGVTVKPETAESTTPEPESPEPEAPKSAIPEPISEAPAPVTEAENAPEIAGDWWERVLKLCGQELDETELGPLASKDGAIPALTEGRLTIYARNMFVQMMVDTAKIRDAVAKAAAQVLGRQVGVSVAVGAPPEEAVPRKPGIDELARFDGIVKFT